ncbi:MAG: inositol monophosphatase [Desulfobulbaceae bacterium]|nr:inositol monophosphatase [Desulfobulbaceae bacterium]
MHRVTACAEQCADSHLAALITAAGAAALEAGAILRDLYGKPHQINHKGAIDLVTEADVAAEQAIIAHLNAAFPDVGFLAEESSAPPTAMPTTPCWIIDPLDGTTNFAHHFPWFATSIGYAEGGEIKAGAIYQPLLDELFLAGRGCGAWLNQKRIRVSQTAELRQSLLATGFPYNIKEKIDEVMDALTSILPRTQGVRRAGAAAMDMAYVACGRLDGFWEINLKPWDTAAGLLLIEEAGGRVSDFRDNPFSPIDNEILVSNALLHGQLAAILTDITY